MQLSLAKSTPTLKSYYSRNSQQKKDFYKNALIIMHLSITYFCMLKDSLKLINHSLASMTGEIFMMFVQGGNEPIIETNFLLKKLWKYGIFRFILWVLKMCLHSNISRFVQRKLLNYLNLSQKCYSGVVASWLRVKNENNSLTTSTLAGVKLLLFRSEGK